MPWSAGSPAHPGAAFRVGPPTGHRAPRGSRTRPGLREFDPARLGERAAGGRRTTFADLITGVLLHDTYHAGQIQMLKRLARSAGLEVPS